jgi:hypothetical protein
MLRAPRPPLRAQRLVVRVPTRRPGGGPSHGNEPSVVGIFPLPTRSLANAARLTRTQLQADSEPATGSGVTRSSLRCRSVPRQAVAADPGPHLRRSRFPGPSCAVMMCMILTTVCHSSHAAVYNMSDRYGGRLARPPPPPPFKFPESPATSPLPAFRPCCTGSTCAHCCITAALVRAPSRHPATAHFRSVRLVQSSGTPLMAAR